MAMLDNTLTPEQIVVAATGTASGTKYSVVLKLNKT
jgi:hypothetical protein